MITTRLIGRLGNQMFQYSAARALALRLGVGIALDSREVEQRGEGVLTRVFDLPLVAPQDLPPDRKRAPLGYLCWRLLGRRPRLRRESGLGYNAAFADWGDGSYLHGYWQSVHYFAEIADTIRRDFSFPEFSSPENADMAAEIARTRAISLHVRRGDYLSAGAHGLCSRAYYEAALEAVCEGLPRDPHVFVFSDDPVWARDNLPLPLSRTIVDFNGPERDFEDMRLMSLCDHNIIANSSFSWWSAWLNTNADKRVAGPARWFGDPKLSNPDILPEPWLRIDA